LYLAADADGGFTLRIGAVERQLLAGLCAELRDMLVDQADDPALRRLFPPAYADDAERDAFYRQMTHDQLLASRLAALDTIVRTVEGDQLSHEDLEAWLTGLNALRLALGTRLDVSEDHDPFEDVDDPENHPDFVAHVAYDYLSQVLHLVVHAQAEAL